ncbi:hypothetical protein CAEBREN_00127 [Caenorhabditis brenneri]|uniref:Uncharacterized protein n=1 Tax=Caenorhabditis brenneri TaxID=135651 RepID=G0MY83_CAEBE|nr:hypothetical protein CAEBREN_00127 [Caenorhabditis brenneri]
MDFLLIHPLNNLADYELELFEFLLDHVGWRLEEAIYLQPPNYDIERNINLFDHLLSIVQLGARNYRFEERVFIALLIAQIENIIEQNYY